MVLALLFYFMPTGEDREARKCVIMKQNVIVWMVLSLFLLSCSEDDKVLYETNNALLNKNNITDVVYVFREVTQDGETLFYGNRKGKDWFALFNSSGILQEEWYGKDRYYERPDMPSLSDSSFGSSFKKLRNGNIAYVYYFQPEEVNQAIYLCDNQKVEYGFIVNENMEWVMPIEENRFLCNDHNIYDFEGNLFVTNHHQNILGQNTDTLHTGFLQDERVWLGYYNEDGNWQEAIGSKPFEKNRRIHVGYGEYKEYSIDEISIDVNSELPHKAKLIETDWGFAFISQYYSYNNNDYADAFLVNNETIYYYALPGILFRTGTHIRNWFDGNILANRSIVLSPTAELISEFAIPFEDTDEIISSNEGIRYNNRTFSRLNYAEGEIIWETWIEKLYDIPSDARITMTIKDKGATFWLYHCDIVNLDGSRSAFEFDLNIETGEISYR